MFSESLWSRKSIGDVDIVFHEGLYHLFHLVLPNHDFIAHAISDNALNWRRVDNALFIGDPGSWDDLMLWTMHVTPDPHQPGKWRMFYTGLSRRDQGRKERVGMAVSDDLFRWRKAAINWRDLRGRTDPERVKEARAGMAASIANNIKAEQDAESCFPLEPAAEFYEASPDNERNWVSFRDPFYFRDGDQGWLLTSARINHGPVVRRGCVGLMEETSPNCFRALPPLHAPMIYDDIEVPNIFKFNGEYYLIGSIREDIKIRYWHTADLNQPWRNYYDNVLLAKGNYAGRVCRDATGILMWNFYAMDLGDGRFNNLLPPPKRLERFENGQLRVTSFAGLAERVTGMFGSRCLYSLQDAQGETFRRTDEGALQLVSEAGFQGFVFDEEADSFRMRCRVSMTGIGKCGILIRIDPRTHDGYYLSLDLLKGIAQLRAWGTGPPKSGEAMMQFKTLQEGYWRATSVQNIVVQVLAFGTYHELSINGSVILSLVDATFARGLIGFYVETAELQINDLVVQQLEPVAQTDEHLTEG